MTEEWVMNSYVMISFKNGDVLIINDKDKLKGVE